MCGKNPSLITRHISFWASFLSLWQFQSQVNSSQRRRITYRPVWWTETLFPIFLRYQKKYCRDFFLLSIFIPCQRDKNWSLSHRLHCAWVGKWKEGGKSILRDRATHVWMLLFGIRRKVFMRKSWCVSHHIAAAADVSGWTQTLTDWILMMFIRFLEAE